MKLSVAHSPDADDLFMYYAIAFGWVGDNYEFSNFALDIESLNESALKSAYEISAISFALYPLIRERYALLRTGLSFGNGYGPKLVKRKGVKLKRNFKVALSGVHTSNALLFKLTYKDARIIYKNFLEIESAILRGEVDAGVLIHENILNYSDELEVEAEIWDIWRDLAGEIPLPLGGMALLRSIPLTKAIDLESILQKAIRAAQKSSQILKRMLMERNLLRVSYEELDVYLSLYANVNSIDLSESQKKGINKMFSLGYDAGLYDAKIDCEDFLIPREYLSLRYS